MYEWGLAGNSVDGDRAIPKIENSLQRRRLRFIIVDWRG